MEPAVVQVFFFARPEIFGAILGQNVTRYYPLLPDTAFLQKGEMRRKALCGKGFRGI